MSGDLNDVSTAAGTIAWDMEALHEQVYTLQENVDGVVPDEEVVLALSDAKVIKEGLMALVAPLTGLVWS